MSAEKSLAIVLRVIEFSETSCVVTLFTRDFGKISALAKGARRPKSPFEAALDLLAVCRVVFLRKSSDALDLLTEAKLERRFRAATRDLSRLYAGYYVVELLRELTDQHDPHPELFDAAVAALEGLDDAADVPATILGFELTSLRMLGHLPSLAECVGCGTPVEATGRVAFGHLAGGVLCPACRAGQRAVVSVSGETMCVLRTFADETERRPETIDPRNAGELRAVVNRYIAHLLGRPPRLHGWLSGLAWGASQPADVRRRWDITD